MDEILGELRGKRRGNKKLEGKRDSHLQVLGMGTEKENREQQSLKRGEGRVDDDDEEKNTGG